MNIVSLKAKYTFCVGVMLFHIPPKIPFTNIAKVIGVAPTLQIHISALSVLLIAGN